jgi:Flp pilus assembly protein TadD
MAKRWGVLATCACVTLLAGCGRLFMSPRPEEAFEERQRHMAEAESRAERRASRHDGASVEEILRDADMMTRAGQIDQAVVGYIDALQADPKSPIPRARIANLQLSRDPERAEALFREIIASQPDAAVAYAGLGLALLARNRPEEAEEPLRRALELDPTLANAHTSLSVVYDLQGRSEEARQHALRARELNPRDATAANNLGVSYLLSGEFVEAERSFEAAALIAPQDAAVRNNLGVALGRQGRYGEALDQFLKAGSEQAAYNNLGYVYLIDGHLDEAIEQFEHALQAEGDQRLVVLRNLNAALDARERGVPAAPAEQP